MEFRDLAAQCPAGEVTVPAEILPTLLRAKPLHFLLGGLLVHFAVQGFGPAGTEVPVLSISPQAQAQLRASWQAATGREPGEEEFRVLLRREADDEILVREALALGLQTRDPVIRQRLVLNMRFLGEDGEDEEALVDRALAMDMHGNDLVVRRRLVQLMEFALSEEAPGMAVSEEELRAMYAARRGELEIPPRWRITQVYFSSERRGEAAERDAVAAAETLRRSGAATREAIALGDPFLGGHELPLLSARQLDGQFGEGFAEGLGRCSAGDWCAPLRSGFGVHVVRIEELQPGRLPGIEDPDVRRRLEADVRKQRGERRLADAMERLRRKYGVGA